MLGSLRYLWRISSGHRLQPWKSPYVRWRLETYFGEAGAVHSTREFFHLLWGQRAEVLRFLRWVEERQSEQRRRSGRS